MNSQPHRSGRAAWRPRSRAGSTGSIALELWTLRAPNAPLLRSTSEGPVVLCARTGPQKQTVRSSFPDPVSSAPERAGGMAPSQAGVVQRPVFTSSRWRPVQQRAAEPPPKSSRCAPPTAHATCRDRASGTAPVGNHPTMVNSIGCLGIQYSFQQGSEETKV